MTYVGCIGGAVLIEEYVKQLKEAGFSDIVVVDTGADLNAYTAIGTPVLAHTHARAGERDGGHGVSGGAQRHVAI
jgi:hypothetical protein